MNKKKLNLSLFIIFCLGVLLGKFAFQKDLLPAKIIKKKRQSKTIITADNCEVNSKLKPSLQSCLEDLKTNKPTFEITPDDEEQVKIDRPDEKAKKYKLSAKGDSLYRQYSLIRKTIANL